MSEIVLTGANFKSEVLESQIPVLVDFWATWCPPCRALAPVIEEIAKSRTDIKVGKVNVDEQPALAAEYGIEAIPTLIVFKGGKAVNRGMGFMPRDQVEALL